MKKFYAAHKCVKTEIAVFNSRQERDEWVNHLDWFSKEFQLQETRIALSKSQAYSLVGEKLHNVKCYIADNILENVKWIIVNPISI